MDRHATWRHKIIRPSVARPIFDHMRWHTKSKPNRKSQDRKGTLAQARPPARPNHKITRVPFRTLGDLISTSELYSVLVPSTSAPMGVAREVLLSAARVSPAMRVGGTVREVIPWMPAMNFAPMPMKITNTCTCKSCKAPSSSAVAAVSGAKFEMPI